VLLQQIGIPKVIIDVTGIGFRQISESLAETKLLIPLIPKPNIAERVLTTSSQFHISITYPNKTDLTFLRQSGCCI
jgi:hypothetical protein